MRTSFDDIVGAAEESLLLYSKSGTEKRVEFDFEDVDGSHVLEVESWMPLTSTLDVEIASKSKENDLLAIICDHCVVCVTTSRCVVLSSSLVKLHTAASSVAKILKENNITIQWASFMRKNFVSVWSMGDKSMIAEYVTLKQEFASGKAYVFGPADKDHYFYFVYDNIDRSRGNVEKDVQLNLVMYDIKDDYNTSNLPEHGITKGKTFQGTRSLGKGDYEIVRVYERGGPLAASFETNSKETDYNTRIQSLLEDFSPRRFSLTMLADPESEIAESLFFGGCGIDLFENYSLVNHNVNEFGPGYAVHKNSFVAK